jgi:SET domain-containing protein
LRLMILACLYVDNTKDMGRGMFTSEDIATDTIIEVSPVVVMSKEEREQLDKTLLHDYIFEWGKDSRQCCMALGYVAVYNHSYRSNCEYEMDYERQEISIKTIRFVKAGEELFLNYNGSWNEGKKVWFDKEGKV